MYMCALRFLPESVEQGCWLKMLFQFSTLLLQLKMVLKELYGQRHAPILSFVFFALFREMAQTGHNTFVDLNIIFAMYTHTDTHKNQLILFLCNGNAFTNPSRMNT